MSLAARPEGVRVRAPGKLNVSFEVGPLQPDGYHAVASAYQAVSLFEDVWAEPARDFSLSVGGSVDVTGVPTDDRNLALRAARLLAHHIGHDGGVRLSIQKHVPVAGGMGGGSADAAATLLACDALWGSDLGMARLQDLAAQLGADVPFALMGGTAIGLGRGDRLSPALATGRFDWVMVVSEVGLSTPAVYHELDRLREGAPGVLHPVDPSVPVGVLQALRSGDPVALAAHLSNDLQAASISLQPALREVLALGEDSGALAGIVSGSGPTLAFLAADVTSALELQVTLSAAGHKALHVHGPVPGARIV
ncbi:4-(cytidine 5'-diphospho)-2-C-methyl-D-erythritol kinase [Microbacterium sediminicola]|uniref:4-diphosphocytidyl-2-C-methyl-D-erythritol kinase n=1 Tax=Microbacterium sediminicola TaxID=415210 RepID=A0ABP4U2E9_9MICO